MRPKNQIDGILLLDKPFGLSSNQALQKVKRHFNIEKAGHTGSLDPMATGVLPLCFGEASKFAQVGLEADKTYQADIQLGQATDTGDAMGCIIETQPIPDFSPAQLAAVVGRFKGAQQQIPPMFSALKRDGKPLYLLAREGKVIERPARTIFISALSLESLGRDKLRLTVTCSKGTYIRTLAEDIAKALGTLGHLTQLRRTAVKGISGPLYTLEELLAKSKEALFLLPLDFFLQDMPCIILDKAQTLALSQGKRVFHPDVSLSSNTGPFRLYRSEGVFFGLGEKEEEGVNLRVKRLIKLIPKTCG